MTTKNETETKAASKAKAAPATPSGIEVAIPSVDGAMRLIAVRAGEKGDLVVLSVKNGHGGPKPVGSYSKAMLKDLVKSL